MKNFIKLLCISIATIYFCNIAIAMNQYSTQKKDDCFVILTKNFVWVISETEPKNLLIMDGYDILHTVEDIGIPKVLRPISKNDSKTPSEESEEAVLYANSDNNYQIIRLTQSQSEKKNDMWQLHNSHLDEELAKQYNLNVVHSIKLPNNAEITAFKDGHLAITKESELYTELNLNLEINEEILQLKWKEDMDEKNHSGLLYLTRKVLKGIINLESSKLEILSLKKIPYDNDCNDLEILSFKKIPYYNDCHGSKKYYSYPRKSQSPIKKVSISENNTILVEMKEEVKYFSQKEPISKHNKNRLKSEQSLLLSKHKYPLNRTTLFPTSNEESSIRTAPPAKSLLLSWSNQPPLFSRFEASLKGRALPAL